MIPSGPQTLLASLLSDEQRARLPQWLAEYGTEGAEVDPDLFAHALFRAGLIDRAQYQAAMRARGRPEITPWLSMPADPRGAAIAGPYLVLGELARGAMGAVHFAKDGLLRRKVAYKRMMRPADDRVAMRRFVAEAQITAQLEHPNIVPIYGVHTTDDGDFAYAMKLVDGRTLRDLVRDARKVAATATPAAEERARAERLEPFLRVCDAMSYAHARGVVHRDLKPANLMVGAYHEVYVMDWGIARVVGHAEVPASPSMPTPDDELTRAGEALGTPRYMAPEQARGELHRIGPATDQYALGLILQELVTLEPAIRAPSVAEALLRAAQAQRGPFVHVNPKIPVPRELAAIVARATAPEPGDRYRDVADLADDVRAHLRGDEVSAAPDTPLRRAGRWLVRHRERALLAVAATVALAASAVIASLVFTLAQSRAAYAHEARVTAAQSASAEAADAVVAELARYARLLEAVSTGTNMVIRHSLPLDGPIRLAPVGREESLDAPVFWIPRGYDGADEARRLARLGELMRRVLVRSAPDDISGRPEAEQRAMVLAGEVPVARIRVALEDGVTLSFPGDSAVTDDPRDEEWYGISARRRFPHWIPPVADDAGRIRAVVSRSIYGEDTRTFLGVAALDVVVGDHLASLALPDGASAAWLVDGSGRTLADSTRPATLAPFPDASVVRTELPTVREDASGLVVVTPLSDPAWFHVARF